MIKSIDNVIKFIETALNKEYCTVYSNPYTQRINVGRKSKEDEYSTKYINFWIEDDKLKVGSDFTSISLSPITISLNEVDKAKWTIVYNKVKEYEARLTEEFFDNFFKENKNKSLKILMIWIMMMIDIILEEAEQALANLEGTGSQNDINAIQRLINLVQEEL